MRYAMWCICVMGVLLTACAPAYQACITDAVRADLMSALQEFQQAEEAADVTQPEELAQLILDLTAISSEVGELSLPECTGDLKRLLLSYMSSTIVTYTMLQSQTEAGYYLDRADGFLAQYLRTFGDIEKNDFIQAGRIQPADSSLFVYSKELTDDGQVRVTLRHTAQVACLYVTGGVRFHPVDYATETVYPIYYLSIAPGERVTFTFEQPDNAEFFELYVEIASAYILRP